MLWNTLNNKVIGIWGMGKEGQSAKRALQKNCTPTDIIEISEDNLEDIKKCQIIIKSPGVSLYRQEIIEAKKADIQFTSGCNLFFANKKPHQKVIAVTGTKGKSTTSSLLAHTLKYLGQNVALGGNIGVPLVDLLDNSADIIVAEMSSYQCAAFDGVPDIGVLVNLYPEHMPWHGSHERYYLDKLNMITRSNHPVLNAEDERTKELAHLNNALYFNKEIYSDDKYFYNQGTVLFSVDKLNLRGIHNQKNACAVLTVIKALGLDLTKCQEAFQTFNPLPHRLQVLGIKNGITYVDDSISTTPETAVAALKAFAGNTITLIIGGEDRGQDFHILGEYIAQTNNVNIVTLPDTGRRADKTLAEFGIKTWQAKTMQQAVETAQKITEANGIVLLSPASPSYNLYKNFEERGADFKRCAGIE